MNGISKTYIKTTKRVHLFTALWTADCNAQNRPTRFTRENANGTHTVITAAYDYLGRRAWKKVETIATDAETGEETATVTLHQRYIYRGYLQVAACDLTRGGHPCLWLITWDSTQPTATRPLAIQKDGTWYCYGWDLTKNVCEVFGQAGYIRTTYAYTPYGSVTEEGDVTQPLQWSSEYADPELGLTYYNYRYYNPTDGRWIRRDPMGIERGGMNLYEYGEGSPYIKNDVVGLWSFYCCFSCVRKCNGANHCRKTKDGCCEKRTKEGNPNYKARPNGCGAEGGTSFPNDYHLIGPKFRFKNACDTHDLCYGKCGADRVQCDSEFRKNLQKACRDAMGGYGDSLIMLTECEALAEAYYLGVMLFAYNAYQTAQDQVCQWKRC